MIAAMLASCTVTQNVTDTKDMSYIYNPARSVYTPFITVFNEGAETSVMNISILRGELYFNEANPAGVPMASMLVSVRLFDNTMGGALADTATFKYDIRKDEVGGAYSLRIPLDTREGGAYSAEIKIIDLIRQRTHQTFIDFERTGPYSGLNYRIRDHFSNSEVFTRVMKRDQYINVLSPSLQPDTLWVFYFKAVTSILPHHQPFCPR
jgi:hypothetical protein